MHSGGKLSDVDGHAHASVKFDVLGSATNSSATFALHKRPGSKAHLKTQLTVCRATCCAQQHTRD